MSPLSTSLRVFTAGVAKAGVGGWAVAVEEGGSLAEMSSGFCRGSDTHVCLRAAVEGVKTASSFRPNLDKAVVCSTSLPVKAGVQSSLHLLQGESTLRREGLGECQDMWMRLSKALRDTPDAKWEWEWTAKWGVKEEAEAAMMRGSRIFSSSSSSLSSTSAFTTTTTTT
eukprot:CAMPEP_0113891954 /NCGR_PEP_ID=MMETSP0780_2-20120614/15091_1 /TAXON_ID=652834 /ORGANISM="Palpitomonas bilix" /LENGTH=168 /DNA_ID=CAMNT_0000881725 /DNA_START=197 /DNA_END=700 /DNA_ORIENTATION=+ /assembly_acc=CAM_ASM_000599